MQQITITVFAFAAIGMVSAVVCPAKPTFVTLPAQVNIPVNGVCLANQICYSSGGIDQCFTCVDASGSCEDFNKNGYCTNSFYTVAQRRADCPSTCALC
ncbi:unnamed protein product, partial [Mesorhabditis spiculigera]